MTVHFRKRPNLKPLIPYTVLCKLYKQVGHAENICPCQVTVAVSNTKPLVQFHRESVIFSGFSVPNVETAARLHRDKIP